MTEHQESNTEDTETQRAQSLGWIFGAKNREGNFVEREKRDCANAAKHEFFTREKRIFVGAAKLILWVDVRGEGVAFSRKKVDVRSERVAFSRKRGAVCSN